MMNTKLDRARMHAQFFLFLFSFGCVSVLHAQMDPNPSAEIGKMEIVDHRPADVKFQAQTAGFTEVHAVDIRTQVPDAWNIHHEMIQHRDSDVNPTSPMTSEEAERLANKLIYRQQLAGGEILLDDLMDGSEGAQDHGGLSGLNLSTGNLQGETPLVGAETAATYSATSSNVPDGAVAVNGAGTVVMANNTHIQIYDNDGNLLLSQNESVFFSSLNPTANIYDPRMEYDTNNNRFILVDMHGNNPTLTEIYIAISATSNPMGTWYFHKIAANPGDSNLWFDYPCLGYSAGTMTISGNMFTASDNFSETKILLFDLTAGYAGNSMGMEYFDDVEIPGSNNNAFTVKPCSYPFGSYGPGSYLISRNSNDDITYWQVSANYGNSPTLSGWNLDVGSVNNPVPAPQSGGPNLGVADRMMSAYVDVSGDDRIHFSFVVSDDNGDNRLYLGRVNTANDNEVHTTFGAGGWDYAYPAIAPWTTNLSAWDQGSMVSFLRVSSTTFPEFRVTHGYPNVNDWANSASIKGGESAIGSGNRWGDYIDAHFRENQSDPECWTFGQYGVGGDHGVWLAQITEDIEGCTNPAACNYDPDATTNDGSCDFSTCAGCMDASACNYNSTAEIDDGSCTYPGCTTLFACNYDSSAGCNDGSCCFANCIDLEMPFGFLAPALGINTMLYYTVTDNNTGEVVASGNNSAGTASMCLGASCYNCTITGANVDWTLAADPTFILFGADYTIESGNGSATFDFILGDGGATAGCTDSSACNYDADALCDNGTCCYSSCITIDMTDTYGDGWNNNFWVIENGGAEVATGTLEGGFEGADIACLEPGCYQFSVDISQGIYTYEIGWSLAGIDLEPTGLSGGSSGTAEFTVAGGGDDMGCTDSEACNYDADALCDDGSCCYDHCVEMIVTDTYGDGWNYATMTLTNQATGSAIELTMEDGFTDTLHLCLESGCYDVSVSEGIYPGEVGWTLSNNGSGTFGGAPYSGYFMLGVSFGCTDSLACNFDASATCDDNTCEYPGCTDPHACNYDECTSCGDMSLCEYACLGCTYASATNYSPNATMDDGSCLFEVPPPPAGCQADLDGDGQVGVNDLLLVLADFGDSCVGDPNGQ